MTDEIRADRITGPAGDKLEPTAIREDQISRFGEARPAGEGLPPLRAEAPDPFSAAALDDVQKRVIADAVQQAVRWPLERQAEMLEQAMRQELRRQGDRLEQAMRQMTAELLTGVKGLDRIPDSQHRGLDGAPREAPKLTRRAQVDRLRDFMVAHALIPEDMAGTALGLSPAERVDHLLGAAPVSALPDPLWLTRIRTHDRDALLACAGDKDFCSRMAEGLAGVPYLTKSRDGAAGTGTILKAWAELAPEGYIPPRHATGKLPRWICEDRAGDVESASYAVFLRERPPGADG